MTTAVSASRRPGQLERYIPGISTKILTERLRRLLDYGLIQREDHSVAATLHVEYQLTPAGARLASIIEQLHDLQAVHTPTAPKAAPAVKTPIPRNRKS